MDALNRSEKKQQIVRKLVKASNKDGARINAGVRNPPPRQQQHQQHQQHQQPRCHRPRNHLGPFIQPSAHCQPPWGPPRACRNRDTVLLSSGAYNHIFNDRKRFLTYTPCIDHSPIYVGTTLADVEGIGIACITVNSKEGKKYMRLVDALYIPSFQSNLVSQAALQEKVAFHCPESQEIVMHGEHLCSVICRGEHYILEEAPEPQAESLDSNDEELLENLDTALAIQRRSEIPRKSTATAS